MQSNRSLPVHHALPRLGHSRKNEPGSRFPGTRTGGRLVVSLRSDILGHSVDLKFEDECELY
jgi:hypothetical protein